MTLITEIADAVTAELNTGGFSQGFIARRQYRPTHDLPALRDLQVTVVPQAVAITTAGRGQNQYDMRIDIAVQKKFDTDEPAELDPLMALVAEIADRFRLQRLAGLAAAMWIRAENDPLYAVEHMDEHRVFTSVLTLTFRVVR